MRLDSLRTIEMPLRSFLILSCTLASQLSHLPASLEVLVAIKLFWLKNDFVALVLFETTLTKIIVWKIGSMVTNSQDRRHIASVAGVSTMDKMFVKALKRLIHSLFLCSYRFLWCWNINYLSMSVSLLRFSGLCSFFTGLELLYSFPFQQFLFQLQNFLPVAVSRSCTHGVISLYAYIQLFLGYLFELCSCMNNWWGLV